MILQPTRYAGSELEEFLKTTYATDSEYEIWNFECHESLGMSGSLIT
jgi:hypothetical protein